MNFGDLINANFGVPTSPGFTQPYTFPASTAVSSSPSSLFGNLSTGQAAGILGASNLLSNIVAQRNQAGSAQSMYDTTGFMTDFNTSLGNYAAAKDFERQMRGMDWLNKYQANNPEFRQNELRKNLAGANSRWGAFLAG